MPIKDRVHNRWFSLQWMDVHVQKSLQILTPKYGPSANNKKWQTSARNKNRTAMIL